ncbi:MAG: metal-dependent hydrolase [Anaerolineae bacterium]
MLPLGHVAYTWAALSYLQSKGCATNVDYRGAALAALLPDLIDKPLTLTVMSGSGTSQGPSHTLLGQALFTAVTARFKPRWLPYALIANAHLLADQMWKYPRTLLFPFSGRFDSWRFMGTPSAMLQAYTEIATRPAILAVEAVGLALFGWFVRRHRLYKKGLLKQFLLAGRIEIDPDPGMPSQAGPKRERAVACA